jgi:hypothetical protein
MDNIVCQWSEVLHLMSLCGLCFHLQRHYRALLFPNSGLKLSPLRMYSYKTFLIHSFFSLDTSLDMLEGVFTSLFFP